LSYQVALATGTAMGADRPHGLGAADCGGIEDQAEPRGRPGAGPSRDAVRPRPLPLPVARASSMAVVTAANLTAGVPPGPQLCMESSAFELALAFRAKRKPTRVGVDACSSSAARAGEELRATHASATRAGAAGVPVDAPSSGISSGGSCGTPARRQRPKDVDVQVECPQGVPLPGSQCGAGNGHDRLERPRR